MRWCVGGAIMLMAAVGATAQDSLAVLFPLPRTLQSQPAVEVTGTVMTTRATRTAAPLTAELAISDLQLYDAQLATLFPRSAEVYPADSLRAAKMARARAWLDRLRAQGGPGTTGRHLLALADVAWRAGDDSLASRYLEMRLARLPKNGSGVVARSLALVAAVELFTAADDTARLARNLPIADAYTRQLAALPAAGYSTMTDSTDVLYRQLESVSALVHAADALQASSLIVTYGERLLDVIARLELAERLRQLREWYPYQEIATALVSQPNGRRRVDSLEQRMQALTIPRASDVTTPSNPTRREAQIAGSKRVLGDRFAQFAMLGRAAPEIKAHVWLNTPDSTYADSARTHSLNDGRVRVVAFINRETQVLPALERIHQQFLAGLEVLLVTETEGHIGPDIATPAQEVAWLATYYEDKRHLTMPIAVWAGAKVPGPYGTSEPAASPVAPEYHASWINDVCLVDAHGIVRGYQKLVTREHEAQLARWLHMLLAESESARTNSRR